MNGFHFLLLFALTASFNLFGQSKLKKGKADTAAVGMNALAGTWRLIEFADMDSATSTWIYAYGKNPKGYFTYTKNGIVNLNISSETPLKISQDSAKNYIVNLKKWVDYNSAGYFGTYTVDFNKSIVTHHVKGGAIPWHNGTDQERPFILKGDTLIIGDSKTWKRVVVKED